MIKRVVGTIAAMGAMLAVGFAAPPGKMGDAVAGKAVFVKKCKTCHGDTGEGNPGMAKALKLEFKPLGSEEVQKNSDADLKKIITEGMGKMKPVKGLGDKEVDDVIAYVRSLKKK